MDNIKLHNHIKMYNFDDNFEYEVQFCIYIKNKYGRFIIYYLMVQIIFLKRNNWLILIHLFWFKYKLSLMNLIYDELLVQSLWILMVNFHIFPFFYFPSLNVIILLYLIYFLCCHWNIIIFCFLTCFYSSLYFYHYFQHHHLFYLHLYFNYHSSFNLRFHSYIYFIHYFNYKYFLKYLNSY